MWAKKLETKPSSIYLLLNCNLLCVSKTPSYLICAILGVFCVSIFDSCLYKPQNDTLQVNQIMLLLSLKPLNSMLMNRREENQMPSRDLQSFITIWTLLPLLLYTLAWPPCLYTGLDVVEGIHSSSAPCYFPTQVLSIIWVSAGMSL